MERYVALLRGVSPLNAKMPELRRAFELAGFQDVRTVLGSGNVLFSAPSAPERALAVKAEAAMKKHLPRGFDTTVRSVGYLEKLLERDVFGDYELAKGSKRVVTFLRAPSKARIALPIEFEGAVILERKGTEVFSAYVPSPRGPVFMNLIEKTFGKDVTTRTWDTVIKLAK